MDRIKLARVMLLLFFVLMILLLVIIFALLSTSKVNTPNTIAITNTTIDESGNIVGPKNNLDTIKKVIEAYNSEYITENYNYVYVNFDRDLYDEKGKSNENFFKNLMDDLEPFYESENYYVIDEEKGIELKMKYEALVQKHVFSINGKEDFYDVTDGNVYNKVQTSEIKKGTYLYCKDYLLQRIVTNEGYFRGLESYLGEGEDLHNAYTSYKDGTIKIRLVPTGAVKNVIFNEDFEGQITANIDSKMSLSKIYEAEPDVTFGGLSEGYLGYRDRQFYMFFYPDEVSVYTYNYQTNYKFEELLQKYLETRDLKRFVDGIKNNWAMYDILKYDEEIQSAYILVSSRGVKIDIKENDPKGITLYGNYCFSDITKQLVKNGDCSYSSKDLLLLTENERRNNSNYFVE